MKWKKEEEYSDYDNTNEDSWDEDDEDDGEDSNEYQVRGLLLTLSRANFEQKNKGMVQIYMQDTIDYILKIDKNLIKEIEQLGIPEVKTITVVNKKIKYYKIVNESNN